MTIHNAPIRPFDLSRALRRLRLRWAGARRWATIQALELGEAAIAGGLYALFVGSMLVLLLRAANVQGLG